MAGHGAGQRGIAFHAFEAVVVIFPAAILASHSSVKLVPARLGQEFKQRKREPVNLFPNRLWTACNTNKKECSHFLPHEKVPAASVSAISIPILLRIVQIH